MPTRTATWLLVDDGVIKDSAATACLPVESILGIPRCCARGVWVEAIRSGDTSIETLPNTEQCMKVVGIFRELALDPANVLLPSLHAARGQLDGIDAEIIASYLRNGVPVFDVMEATQDPFNPETFIPGGPSLLSDGTWIWRKDLAHYVERYQVDVAKEFIEHVRDMEGIRIDERSVVARWEEVLATYERVDAGAP